MRRFPPKKKCKTCTNPECSDACRACKHNYTSNYQEKVSRPSHDKAGENMSCHTCSYWKPLDGVCCTMTGKDFPHCHSMNQPVKVRDIPVSPTPEHMTPDKAYEALKGKVYGVFVCFECKQTVRGNVNKICDKSVCDKCFSRMSGPGPELG